jgi:molybdopterin-binding protein
MNSNGQAIVHVTHDYIEAVSLGTHIAVMEEGTIAQIGTAEEIFQHPKSEFVARFVGIKNFFRGRLEGQAKDQGGLRWFRTNGFAVLVLTDSNGGDGFACIRSEDVTICNTASRTSARNNLEGEIIDIAPVGVGVEVMVDVGVEIAALVSSESVKALDLRCGKKVWVSFKASAARYIER